MKFAGSCALDVETHGTHKETSDPRIAPFLLAAVAPHNIVTRKIPRLTTGSQVTVHNTPYDSVVCGEWDCEWDDTKQVAHLLGEPDTSLKGLVSRHLNRPAFVEGYSDPEKMADQCMWDAHQTWELLPVLISKLDEGQLNLYNTLEKPLLPLWCQMTLQGSYGLDIPRMNDYRSFVESRVVEIEKRVKEELPQLLHHEKQCLHCELWDGDKEKGSRCRPRPTKNGGETTLHEWSEERPHKREVNLNAPHQLKEAFERRGIYLPDTEVGTLQRYAVKSDEIALLVGHRNLTKRLRSYILPALEMAERNNGIIGGIWNPTGTWHGGRVSCTRLPMQTLPEWFMEYVLPPRDGWSLLEFDNAQLEVRVSAHVSRDPFLIEACRSGDFHGYIQEEFSEKDRRRAKVYVFSTLYNITRNGPQPPYPLIENAAKAGIRLTLEEAKAIQAAVLARAGSYLNDAMAVASSRDIQGLFGRRLRVPAGSDQDYADREAVNSRPQAGAGDITKMQQLKLWQAGYWVVRQCHDSVTICVPNSEVEDARVEVPRMMESVVDWDVPLKVEEKT